MPCDKPLEPVERTLILKYLCKAGQRVWRRVDTGATAGGKLGAVEMGCAVGTEKEGRVTGHRSGHQSAAMRLALDNGKAVIMRPDSPRQNVIAIDEQMVGRERSCDRRAAAPHIINPVGCCHMFHDNTKFRQTPPQRIEHPLDENRLTIEDVDLGIRDLAMNAERDARVRHGFKHRCHRCDIAHARIRICRCPGRIQLDRGDDSVARRRDKIRRIRCLGEIERHQRDKVSPAGKRRHDPLAIGRRLCARYHRRHQIRHDQRTPEISRAVRCDSPEHGAVTKMKVPVIGAGQCQ